MKEERSVTASVVQDWLVSSLTAGLALDLSRAVGKQFDPAMFEYRAYIDASLSEEQIVNFAEGGKVGNTVRADNWLIESVMARRSNGSSGFWMVEDWTARPEHQALRKYAMPTRFLGNQVYYVTSACDPRDAVYWKRMFSNHPPAFHGFFVENCEIPEEGSPLTDDVIGEIAKHVAVLFLGIYDGESYLLCTRR
jgi:hypothetical protein